MLDRWETPKIDGNRKRSTIYAISKWQHLFVSVFSIFFFLLFEAKLRDILMNFM